MTVADHPWLRNAVFYQVFPASFADSDGDGIGDLQGIVDHLDYLAELGVTALWLNPCYDSPFRDAGYDVRDYTKVAARYGTNDDLERLFREAHDRGIHVLLDLVPGHTSDEHPWFRASAEAAPNDYDERFIWTDSWITGGDGLPFIGGEADRDGAYITNFFAFQPALNYGFAHPARSWQKPAGGEDALETEAAIVDVMRFWLKRGADGFRVDMADSLVKNDDDGKPYTRQAWHRMFSAIRAEFPDAVFVSEWGRPDESFDAGFDMDFYLDWRWDGVPNGYNMLLRNCPSPLSRDGDMSYFNADSGTGIAPFLREYRPRLDAARDSGCLFNLITCNHDTARIAPRLSPREIAVAYATMLAMPGAPFVYYGDEIGMRYRSLPTKEGAYTRTGSRTPMQWDAAAPDCGFSTAPAADLYLPLDDGEGPELLPTAGTGSPAETPSRGAGTHVVPTVAAQRDEPGSLWNTVREMIRLRNSLACLDADADFDVVYASDTNRSFIFKRTAIRHDSSLAAERAADAASAAGAAATANDAAGESVIVAVNPSRDVETHSLSRAGETAERSDGELLATICSCFADDDSTDESLDTASILFQLGDVSTDAGTITLGPQSFAILVLR
ncbi:alpha-amylase family glycosyl hydrolase [Bifidobacterium choloepi]|uniref:Alpha-amylase n=1 Tax=Bifidobacterium choloepi TaxID=2614131 RepID=A0A6I5N2Z6_9BIFI|nr:alpha-amylase family glycosyl hydrolase [Bifidobacterium choloepi]NEG70555.1 alpha-amylase [Bifidobacterium choloepi]